MNTKYLRAIGLVTTTAFNEKVIEIENKVPDIANLATEAALNTKTIKIENKNLILVILLVLKNSSD